MKLRGVLMVDLTSVYQTMDGAQSWVAFDLILVLCLWLPMCIKNHHKKNKPKAKLHQQDTKQTI